MCASPSQWHPTEIYTPPETTTPSCHPERSEGSRHYLILRCAPDDRESPLPSKGGTIRGSLYAYSTTRLRFPRSSPELTRPLFDAKMLATGGSKCHSRRSSS